MMIRRDFFKRLLFFVPLPMILLLDKGKPETLVAEISVNEEDLKLLVKKILNRDVRLQDTPLQIKPSVAVTPPKSQ